MSDKAYLIGAAVFAVLGVASWSMLLAQEGTAPAPAEAAPGAVAVADVMRIARDFDEMKAGQKEMETFQIGLAKEMDNLDSGRFLDEAEQKELYELQKIAQPNAEQQKRLRELTAMNTARADRLRTLQQTPNKNAQETADFEKLTKQSQAMDEKLRALEEEQRRRLDTKATEINDRLTNTVLAALSAVAKEKNLAVVFDKQAVLYGWNDITDDVLKKLNPGSATATTPPPAPAAPATPPAAPPETPPAQPNQ